VSRDDILAMKPGNELNALVAEKIMGWEWHDREWSGGPKFSPMLCRPNSCIGPQAIPDYSTDIATAWEVVQVMPQPFMIQKSYEKEFYEEEYDKNGTIGFEINWCDKGYCGIDYCMAQECVNKKIWCKTAPEAICKAALLAVMGDKVID